MNALERMQLSLTGLSVGDALGERFFESEWENRIPRRQLPPGPWPYTDDTEMAVSIAEVLRDHGRIKQDLLVQSFVRRYNPTRGYGLGAHQLLRSLRAGADWHSEAPQMFGGQGSFGNGAAMRVAPLGAYFAEDLELMRENAVLSAQITHAHPEGVAGAIAVATAAALAFRAGEGERTAPERFLKEILARVPDGKTRDGLEEARGIPFETEPDRVAHRLGSGQMVSAQDTVPYALWCAARHLDDFEKAFWATLDGLGDRDTTCAIVGGITALSARKRGIPPSWIKAREPLPADIFVLSGAV